MVFPFLPRIEAAPWRFATLCYLLVAIARVTAVQLVPIAYVTDEATWMAASRWFWLVGQANTHAGRMPVLFPALLSPVFGLLDFERAYALAKSVNALIVTAALFPIWRLARRFTRDGIAIAVAGISVVGIPASYAAVIMADSVFFFLFWILFASFARLVVEPGRGSAIAFGLSASALVATKPQALPALGVLAIALLSWSLWSRRGGVRIAGPFPGRIVGVAFGTLIAGLLAVAWLNGGTIVSQFYASNERVYGLEIAALLDHAFGLVALLAIGTGILPFLCLLGPLRKRPDEGFDRGKVFLLAVAGVLLVGYVVFASAFGVVMARDRLPERQVAFLYPAVLVLAVGMARSRRGRSSPVTAVIAGLVAAALLSYGLSRYPAPDVLEVADAPTRAAIARLSGLSGGTRLAAALAGVLVAIGYFLRGVGPRLAVAGATTLLLGIGVCLAQIRWSATWAWDHYRQLRVESVLIPDGARVVLLAEGVPDDIRLFETARRLERLRLVAAAHLVVDGPGGEVHAASAAATEEFWVATRDTLLRNELVYSEAGHRVYRVSSSPPRILARFQERKRGALEIEYYPADPWADEVTFVLEAKAEAAQALAKTKANASGRPPPPGSTGDVSVVEVESRRGADGAFREVLVISGCGDVPLLSGACPVLKRLFVIGGEGRLVLDDLYP